MNKADSSIAQPSAHARQSTMQPVPAAPVRLRARIEFVDILRGFALLGVLIMNFGSFSGQTRSLGQISGDLDRAVILLGDFLVQAKFYSFFSLLFGWGMAIQMMRARVRGTSFLPVFLRRLLILLGIGLLHGVLIWTGDILTAYALFGFLLILFRNRSPRTILLAAGFMLLLPIVILLPGETMEGFRAGYEKFTAFLRWETYPESLYSTGSYLEITRRRFQEFIGLNSWMIYYFGNVFAMFLVGLYIGKQQIFKNIQEHLPLVRRVLLFGLLLGIPLNFIFAMTTLWASAGWPPWIPPEFYSVFRVGVRTLGAPMLTLAYASGLILLLQKPEGYVRLSPLGQVGRLSLSNYLLQSVIGTLIFYSYGLGLYGEIGPGFGLVLTLIIFAGQIRFSSWWLARYQFGPAEYLWRILTYGRRQPLRTIETYANLPTNRWILQLQGIRPVRALLVVWAALLLWAAALAYGYASLGPAESSGAPGLQNTLSSGTQFSIPTQTVGLKILPETPALVLTPDVQAVPYNPGPIAASGDLLALARTFEMEIALGFIESLSGPPYDGRYAGSPGGQAAGDELARRFAEYGLQPAGDNGSFFQAFPIEYARLAETPKLAIVGPDGSDAGVFQFHRDFAPLVGAYAGAGQAEGEVVWVNNCTREDFQDLDLVSKVALCRTLSGGTSNLDAGRFALEHGAAGLLLLADPDARPLDSGSTFGQVWVPSPIPTFWVSPAVADALLQGTGQSAADLTTLFTSRPLEGHVRLEIATHNENECPPDGCQGRNVLGVLPGRDPAYAHEVVLLSAHYDHLGRAPNGLIWPGANGNASGVAVLLEIARSWHQQGYVPRRTVLFAAWDAGEMGSLGSQQFLTEPRYPLESIVGLIELERIGAGGDVLHLAGGETVLNLLSGTADGLGEPSEVGGSPGRSSAQFLDAGVPAGYVTWSTVPDKTSAQGRPVDTPGVISGEKIQTIGRFTDLALLGLTEAVPSIEVLLADRAQAIVEGDRPAFLRTSQAERRADEGAWFDDIQDFAPEVFNYEVSGLHLTSEGASGQVRMSMTYLPSETNNGAGQSEETSEKSISTSLPVRFVYEGGAWKWGGADLATADGQEGAFFRIAVPAGETNIPGLQEDAAALYAKTAALLGLPAELGASINLYPDARALAADTALSLAPGTTEWVGSNTLKLVHTEQITQSITLAQGLTHLLLARTGIEPEAAPWLWQGLPAVLAGRGDPESLQRTLTPHLRPALFQEAGAETNLDSWTESTSWAATDFLQRQLGWEGLGRFLLELGQACAGGLCSDESGLNRAMLRAVGLSGPAFQNAWQEDWRRRFSDAQESLNQALQIRTAAVLGGDRDQFLSQVDPAAPFLLAEQRGWFDDLERFPAESFELTGTPVAFRPDGGILANVTMRYSLAGVDDPWGSGNVTTLLAFTPAASGLLWAGTPLERLSGTGAEVYYPAGSFELAMDILAEAQQLSGRIASDLAAPEPGGVAVKLYPDNLSLRASISLSYRPTVWSQGWTAAGESVKLSLANTSQTADIRSTLAALLTRSQLIQMGVDSEWLLKGVSVYESGRLNLHNLEWLAAGYLPRLAKDVSQDQVFSLTQMPFDHELEEEKWLSATAQAWDTVRLLADRHGEAALRSLLQRVGAGISIDQALRQITGQPLLDFENAWKQSLAEAHAEPEWLAIANELDSAAALDHIENLVRPEYLGRQAGSPGAESAAMYIAGRFAAYGLVPLDRTLSAWQPENFFQRFPIQYARLLETPRLAWALENGTMGALRYRQDFVSALSEIPNAGAAAGSLVWVQDATYSGMDLSGKIVLRRLELGIREEMLRAMDHGASGLILIGEQEREKDFLAKQPLPIEFTAGDSIPVLVLTEPGYVHLLSQIGQTPAALLRTPPALPLDAWMSMDISVTEPITVETANVLGYLPGSDPSLRSEVIVLGAHHDHVGDDPQGWLCANLVFGQVGEFDEQDCEHIPGLAYAGANDNASGVALLLEIARVWHETGYRPKRSVLFAGWAAQEPGEAGSAFYVQNPAVPLEHTVATIQLDAIGGGSGFRLLGRGFWDADARLLFSLEAAEDLLGGRLKLTPAEGDSDDQPFRASGIPTVLLSWADASEDNWPDRIADVVDPKKLEISGQMVMLLVMTLAR